MKTEDIDKKIGMPDVNAEWAKFEREVISEETQPKKRSLAPWAWGIGIAASIAVVAGLFLFGNGSKGENEGSVAMAEVSKSEVPEEKDENDGNAEKSITGNIIDNTSENLLAEAVPSPEEEASVPMPVQDVTDDDFSLVEESPHFPGGDRAMVDFIRKNLRYPALAQAYVTKGRVVMSMTIDTLGQVSDIKAQRFMLDYAPSLLSQTSEAEQTKLKADISSQLEEECARVIAMMPTWQPGRVMGKSTNVKYYIPFQLQSDLLAKVSDSEAQDSLQRRIARFDIVPNSSHLGANTMRLIGTSTQNGRDKDSVLVMVDGEAMLMAKNQITTKENLEHLLKKDIESIMVYMDEDNKRPYVEKYGELAKKGVVDIKTKPAPRTYEYEVLANAVTEEALQGRIAGLNLDDKPFHFVRETDRPSLPRLWERDTVLTLVNGKEDLDFLSYLSGMSHWSMSNVFDYFFERNQLFLMQSLPSKEVQAAHYTPSLFEGRDIRLVVDYLTKPFTPVSQLTQEQIYSRRLAYLQNKYRAGFSKNSNQEYYAPDLYDTPAKERLFGLTAAKCRSYGQRHEYFGPMGSDSYGIYVPLIRDVVLTTNDATWWENGEVWILKDDPCFNQVVIDIRQAATCAESSVVTNGDSIVRLAFIFGGKVIEGQTNDLISGMQKQLYEIIKESTFEFKPNVDAPSWWWVEAYYSTASQRHLWMHLHSVDKLYAVDSPELLSNRRHVEGTVTDEKGAPLAETNVGIGFVTPWDAITTDSNGHFDLWMPFRDAAIRVNHAGYIPKLIQPTDTSLVIRMKDATKLSEVKELTIQRLPGIGLRRKIK